jgi:hypothetical protein
MLFLPDNGLVVCIRGESRCYNKEPQGSVSKAQPAGPFHLIVYPHKLVRSRYSAGLVVLKIPPVFRKEGLPGVYRYFFTQSAVSVLQPIV